MKTRSKSRRRLRSPRMSAAQNRSTDTAILVRLTAAQKARLEAAARKLVAGTPGAKVVLAGFLLALGLREADAILGPEKK